MASQWDDIFNIRVNVVGLVQNLAALNSKYSVIFKLTYIQVNTINFHFLILGSYVYLTS